MLITHHEFEGGIKPGYLLCIVSKGLHSPSHRPENGFVLKIHFVGQIGGGTKNMGPFVIVFP